MGCIQSFIIKQYIVGCIQSFIIKQYYGRGAHIDLKKLYTTTGQGLIKKQSVRPE